MLLLSEAVLEVVIFVSLFVVGFGVFRVAIHFVNKNAIATAARAKGWKRIEIKWAPFSPGFLFENGERHYRVTFTDKDDCRKTRLCKTGMLTGVYWRD